MISNSGRPFGRFFVKLVIAVLLAANLYTILHGIAMDSKVPCPAKGNAYFIYEELLTEPVTDIDATEDYIYFLYRPLDVISAYDWNGNYQFSVCFDRSAQNGVLYMECDAEKLYVNDK